MPLDLKNIHDLPTLEKYLIDERFSRPMKPEESPFLSVLKHVQPERRRKVLVREILLAYLVLLVFLFLGKWVYEVVMNVVERRMQGAELLMQILVWSSLSAFVTAVAGVLALMALRPVLETRAA